MIEATVQLARSPESLRASINAIARPRRGGLHSPHNALKHHEDDPQKPYWGHWQESRFSLRPQSRGRWTNLHLWSTQFDGEARLSATGSELWIRASFGTYATTIYLILLSLLLFTAIAWMLHEPLTACIVLGLAAALVYGLYAQLRRGLANLMAALDRRE